MTWTAEDVSKHIQGDGAVTWTEMSELKADVVQSCVDGRAGNTVVGTPGGDAGELLVQLAALEARGVVSFGDESIARILSAFVADFGRFYMHTDSHAMGNLMKALQASDAFASQAGDLAAVEKLVRSPGAQGEALMPFLLEPSHVGCGHLKLILLHPEEYGVRRGLTQALIRSVFRLLWAGGAVDYVVLLGGHAEGAVVQVRHTEACGHRVPKVAPLFNDRQVFVQHPEAVGWMRTRISQFLVEQVGALAGADAAAITDEVDTLAGSQLGSTLKYLADGLPIYQAVFDADSGVTVS